MNVNKKILTRLKPVASASLAFATLLTNFPHQNVKAGGVISCCLGCCCIGQKEMGAAERYADQLLGEAMKRIISRKNFINNIKEKLNEGDFSAPQELIEYYLNEDNPHNG